MQGRPSDPSKLSQNPKQIRNRLRRHAGKLEEDVAMYSMVKYGKPIEDWDLEELARGRPRSKNGKFNGAAPGWITPTIQKEARRRLLDHTLGKMAGHIDLAIQTVVNLIMCDEVDERGKPLVDPKTKLQGCMFIIEHFLGKPKAFVELAGGDEKKVALAAAIVLEDGKPQDEPVILDGEWEDKEEEEDDDDSDG